MASAKKNTSVLFILFLLSYSAGYTYAQDDAWREKMKDLQYSPRYFGPNAFPMPELRSGMIDKHIEAEIRGEYHFFDGDRTKDIYTRLFIPVAKGCAALEVSYLVYEYYNTTAAVAEERHAAGTSWKTGAHGDVVVSSLYQVLSSKKWADIMVEATLKTASGNRLPDARYTDAATYWFNINAGRNLYESGDNKTALRIQGLMGFYCWMTNDMIHRQNDALAYAVGLSGKYQMITFSTDIGGIYGYKNNGDRPLKLRTKLNFEHKKNILSLRFNHGMKDNLYDCLSVAYVRYF